MVEYEFEGKTTEDAMENASRELGLPAEELTFDILEPGSAGIFGLVGGKKAKIRVTVESPATTAASSSPGYRATRASTTAKDGSR